LSNFLSPNDLKTLESESNENQHQKLSITKIYLLNKIKKQNPSFDLTNPKSLKKIFKSPNINTLPWISDLQKKILLSEVKNDNKNNFNEKNMKIKVKKNKPEKSKNKKTKLKTSDDIDDGYPVKIEQPDEDTTFICIHSFQNKNHTLIQNLSHDVFKGMLSLYWHEKTLKETIIRDVYLKYQKLTNFIEKSFKTN
jgi:hypothetical protein